MAGNKVVVAGSSATSVLWWVVSGDSKYTGHMASVMPVSSLTAAQKTDIQGWIDGGAAQ